jgi:hypothetical protein
LIFLVLVIESFLTTKKGFMIYFLSVLVLQALAYLVLLTLFDFKSKEKTDKYMDVPGEV